MNIDVSNLPGNSNLEKAKKVREEKNTTQVQAPVRKAVAKGNIHKSTGTKLRDIFIVQDIADVMSNIFSNVFVPRLRQLAYEIADNAARGVFLGENVEFSAKRTGHTNYNSISSGGKTYTRNSTSSVMTSTNGYKFETVEFDDYGKARLALDSLDEIMQESDDGVVTVADLYSTSGILSYPFTANYYGWDDISSAKIKFDGNKYWIKFPKVKELKD